MVLAAAVTLYLEYRPIVVSQRVAPAVMALAAGATSGFSGISGPLKGLAIRNLALDRMHFVGACSIVSLASDGTKVAVYSTSALINDATWPIVLLSLPLMPIAAYFGRLANFRGGERLFRGLFWLVIGGYMVRLLAT